MSNTANRVGSGPKQSPAIFVCAHAFGKHNLCYLTYIFFCWYSLSFLVAWWFGWLHSPTVVRKKTTHIGHFYTLFILHCQGPQYCAEDPYAATKAWHLLMLVTSLVTHCCGMASHSSTRICRKSANMFAMVSLARTARPSWSHLKLKTRVNTNRRILQGFLGRYPHG